LILLSLSNFLDTPVTWSSKTVSTIHSINTILNSDEYTVASVAFRRRIIVTWDGDDIRGNGGTDAVRMTLGLKLGAAAYITIGQQQLKLSFTSNFHKFQIIGEGTIEAGVVAKIKAVIDPFAGGQFQFRWFGGPVYNGYFKIQLIPY
jgi:hypothetical protein